MIYFITFLLSIFFLRLADKFRKDKVINFCLIFVGLLFPILLYACRDNSVGYDVNMYVERFFKAACKAKSFTSFRNSIEKSDFLYLIINYSVSRFTSNLFWMHFVIQSIIICCIYYGAFSFRSYYPIWITFTLYYLLFFPVTMNLVRQSIAVAISLVSLIFYLKDKKSKSVIFFILAILSHPTALICILYCVIDYIIKIRKNWIKWLVTAIFFLTILMTVYKFQTLLTILLSSSQEAGRYQTYQTSSDALGVSKSDLFIKFFILCIFYYALKKDAFDKKFIEFSIMTTILSILLVLINLVASKAGRFAFYFLDFFFISVPIVFFSKKIQYKYRLGIQSLFILVLMIAFYSMYILHGDINGQLYPYKSKILNF